MNNKSRKAKGRVLQNLVRDKIIKLFPVLGKDDIRTSLMSEAGADVKLISLTARKLFPLNNKIISSYFIPLSLVYIQLLISIVLAMSIMDYY